MSTPVRPLTRFILHLFSDALNGCRLIGLLRLRGLIEVALRLRGTFAPPELFSYLHQTSSIQGGHLCHLTITPVAGNATPAVQPSGE